MDILQASCNPAPPAATLMTPSELVHTPITQLRAKKRPAVRYAILVLALFCTLLVAAQAWSAWSARQSRLAETAAATSNMAGALAAQAESTIRIVDTVLSSVVEQVEHEGLSPDSAKRLRTHMRSMVASTKELHGLFVYGPDGAWLVTSLDRLTAGNNADREYFQYHRDHKDRGLHIGAPIRSRSTGKWVLPISRRLDQPDGSFGGVALGTIQVDFFADLYDSFHVGKEGVILLALDNGVVIYRRPFLEKLIGQNVAGGPIFQTYRAQGPVGSAMLRSRIDGVVRLYSYRHLGSLPLLVATAQAKDEILAEWQQSTLFMTGGTILIVVLLVGVGARLVRQIMIRDQLEGELVIAKEHLQERNRELTVLATRDALTDIANRRHFEDVLLLELARAARNGAAVSLVLVDVDLFKKYNDRYGHVAGDACLRQLAATLREELARPTDLVARYGGEEFGNLRSAAQSGVAGRRIL